MSKNEKNPIVFQNERVTVFKNGTWACETCRRKARSRGIRQPDVIPRGKRCKSTDEYGSICNKYYLDDPDLAEINNTAQRRREEDTRAPPPPTGPPPTVMSPEMVEAGCYILGGVIRCIAGAAALGQGGTRQNKRRKTRGRKTRGRKTRGRKTRGRKTRQRKRKNTKNTRYQKRAR